MIYSSRLTYGAAPGGLLQASFPSSLPSTLTTSPTAIKVPGPSKTLSHSTAFLEGSHHTRRLNSISTCAESNSTAHIEMVISCSNRKRGYRTQIRNLFTGGKIDPYMAVQQPSELHVGVLGTK